MTQRATAGASATRRNLLTDVAGLTVGCCEDQRLASGVTVVLFDEPAIASVSVSGGSPAGRDLGCLEPDARVEHVDAIVLSGGSAFGLDAASGVQAFLREGWICRVDDARFVMDRAGLDFLTRSFGGADGFAAQHRLMQDEERPDGDGGARIVGVNAGESPLARLKLRGLVDGVQFAAGEKLRRDFTLGQMTPRMGVNWGAPVVSGGRGASADHQSDIAVAARQRLNRALAALGPGLSDLAFDICCHLKTLEEAERGRGWAQRAARVVLKIALDRLAAHYGMGVTRSSAPVRAWHAPEAV